MNNRAWLNLDEDRPIVKCNHCNQWAAVYTQCGHCGAPIEGNDELNPLVACDYCGQFGIDKTECSNCGAPMPDKIIRLNSIPDSPYWTSPYFIDGGSMPSGGYVKVWSK